MLPHLLLASLGLINQTNLAMPSALQRAMANSFNFTAESVDIAIQADFADNRLYFLDVVDGILTGNEWNFCVQVDVNNDGIGMSGRYNLWFVDSYQAFSKLYPQILRYTSNSVLSFMIVLRLPSYESSTKLIDRLFSDLLQSMVVNVIVFIEPVPGEVLLYTSFPFQDKACHSKKSVLLNRFVDDAFESSTLFPSKAENIWGCPLRVIAKDGTRIFLDVKRFQKHPEDSGLEAEVLNVIATKMNFTLKVSQALSIDIDEHLTNLTAIGFYKLLADGKADIIIGSHVHDPILDQLFSASRTYFHNTIVLTVRRLPYELPKLSWLLDELDGTTWICFLLLVLATALIIAIAASTPKLTRIFHLKPDYSRVPSVIEVAVGMPTPHLPSITFLRFCFIIWSLGLLILRAAYQGKMFDSYRQVINKEPPVTMEELLDAHYTIYSRPALASAVDHLKGLVRIHFHSYSSLGSRVRSSYKTAVVGSKAVVIADATPEELQTVVMENLQTQLVCMFFQRHSFMAPKVNRIIAQLDRGGFLQFWTRKYNCFPKSKMSPQKSYTPGPVSLQRFQYIMLCFAVSHAIALVAFFVEFSWHWLQRHHGPGL